MTSCGMHGRKARHRTSGGHSVEMGCRRKNRHEDIQYHQGWWRYPAGRIGADVAEQDRLAGDIERVHELLTNAPADRAWRRRGYLTMCRAHSSRLQLKEIDPPDASMTPRSRRRAKLMAAETHAETEGRTRGSWVAAVAGVVTLEEEGVFRRIIGYL